jgi:iron complex transport system substrate-binding protein
MAKRIVSLASSATELIGEMGLGISVVGRSHECDTPENMRALPVCTDPRPIRYGMPAPLNKADTRQIVREALSSHRVIPEMLAQLKPEIIVTEPVYKNYGLTIEELQAAVQKIIGSSVEIVFLECGNLNEISSSITKLGEKLGAAKSRETAEKIQQRLAAIQSQIKPPANKPTVVALQWLKPPVAAGYWIPTLIEQAGGQNLISKAGMPPRPTSWDEIIRYNPDMLLLMPTGFSIEKISTELIWLSKLNEFRTLSAFKNKQIFVVDGNLYFNRPTARLADSLGALSEIFNMPKAAKRKYFGTVWVEFF